MMKYLFNSLFLLLPLFSQAQSGLNGKLYGNITDQESGEPIIFANVVLMQNGIFITGGETDFDGNYNIPDIPPGTYNVKISQIEYSSKTISGVQIKAGENQKLDIQMQIGQTLDAVIVTGYSVPVIEQDNSTQGGTVTAEQIRKLPRKRISKKRGRKEKDVTFNTESYAHIEENSFHKPTDRPLSTFSIDVDNASYTNTRRMINQGDLPQVDAVRIEEFINYFDYNYPQPKDEHPFAVHTALGPCPWNPDHRLVRIGLKGEEMEKAELPPSNLVFLLDVSGSMNTPQKLPLLIDAFEVLVAELDEADKVSIVVYAGASGLVLPPTSGAEKEKILEALNQLNAGGSTAGAAGIELAYKTAKEHFIENGNNRVILATDGDFNIGTSSDGALIRLIESKRDDGIFLSVLGFGMGNYKDSKMEGLADHGNGNYYYIDQLKEAKRIFTQGLTSTLYTIAKDVKIQIEFNPEEVSSYRLIGYENRLLKDEDFNNDKKDAGEIGAGHTVTALYEIVPKSAEFVANSGVDPLKYQKSKSNKTARQSGEWMTVKLRYKKPKSIKSILLQTVINSSDYKDLSQDFTFAASVAGFGMLLRDSEFKGNCDYQMVLELAKAGMGADKFGNRAEFIQLVEMVEEMGVEE